jgi:hypothetical protein
VLAWLVLLFAVLRVASRSRRDVVVENLLLRQQLTVALRARPRPPLRRRDRLFWLAARRLCIDWRRHLVCGLGTSSPPQFSHIVSPTNRWRSGAAQGDTMSVNRHR